MKKTVRLVMALLLVLLATFAFVACTEQPELPRQPFRVEFNEEIFTDFVSCEIVDNEVFAYNEKESRINYDKKFIEVNGNIYYVLSNRVVTGIYLLNTKVYAFGKNGEYLDLPINHKFFEYDGATYYIVNNTIVKNRQVINSCVYDFGNDGKMVTGWKDGFFYDYEGKLHADKMFIHINDSTNNGYDTYYMLDNAVVYNQVVIDGSIYNFGNDGKMIKGKTHEGYSYGNDGRLKLNEDIIMINNDKYSVYYLKNNTIVEGEVVISGAPFYFDSEGVMFIGRKDGSVYCSQGFIVTINGKEWMAINGALYGLNEDTDGDTITNIDEVNNGTNPGNKDTDGDKVDDNKDKAPLDPSTK